MWARKRRPHLCDVGSKMTLASLIRVASPPSFLLASPQFHTEACSTFFVLAHLQQEGLWVPIKLFGIGPFSNGYYSFREVPWWDHWYSPAAIFHGTQKRHKTHQEIIRISVSTKLQFDAKSIPKMTPTFVQTKYNKKWCNKLQRHVSR